jgi:DNA replication protein DnaC
LDTICIWRFTDAEWEYRENRKIKNLKYIVKFRKNPHSLNVDAIKRIGYWCNGTSTRAELYKKNGEQNFIGSSGTGKSYIAQVLGNKSCEMLINST